MLLLPNPFEIHFISVCLIRQNSRLKAAAFHNLPDIGKIARYKNILLINANNIFGIHFYSDIVFFIRKKKIPPLYML